MTLPDDATPPDPGPLSERRKAELKAQLIASAQPRHRRDTRWLVPGLTAAAVLAIVATSAIVVATHDDAGKSVPGDGFGPAARARATTHPTHHPAGGPPAHARLHHPAPISKRQVTVGTVPTFPVDDPVTCDEAIANLHRAALDGASVTADRRYDGYTTSLYESQSAWIVCDDFAAADGGEPTLFAPHDTSDAYRPDLDTLEVSQNALMDANTVQFVAGGRDFDGVQAISYAFPDGHTENAVIGGDGLWSMAYLVDSGPLADPNVDETSLDPIQVTVEYTDGTTDLFTLDWFTNTCAQINHGC